MSKESCPFINDENKITFEIKYSFFYTILRIYCMSKKSCPFIIYENERTFELKYRSFTLYYGYTVCPRSLVHL